MQPAVSPDRDETRSEQRTRHSREFWRDAFLAVRAETERRAAPLSAEDQLVQSMPDASPTKWHRAHTTWFFEQFLLNEYAQGYKPFDDRFAFLFNSYYVAAGPRHARPMRGLLTRPAASEVTAYRAHVDAAVAALIASADDATFARIAAIVEIGLHHEQQHQELLLTDILHAFAQNPVLPAYDRDWTSRKRKAARVMPNSRPAFIRSVSTARVSVSITNCRCIACCCSRCKSQRASSATASGWISSPTTATHAPISGCPMASRKCKPRTGRRRAIGSNAMANGWR